MKRAINDKNKRAGLKKPTTVKKEVEKVESKPVKKSTEKPKSDPKSKKKKVK